MAPTRSRAATVVTGLKQSSRNTEPHHPTYFFLDRDGQNDPRVKRLQEAVVHNLPMLRRYLLGICRDDSLLNDYVDRLYTRFRKVVGVVEPTDGAILSRFASIIHEDRRKSRKRFAQMTEDLADPNGLSFFEELLRSDALDAFRDCLDDWTAEVLDLRLSTRSKLKDLAKACGLNRNAFDQRWRRGIEAGAAEYLRRYS